MNFLVSLEHFLNMSVASDGDVAILLLFNHWVVVAVGVVWL